MQGVEGFSPWGCAPDPRKGLRPSNPRRGLRPSPPEGLRPSNPRRGLRPSPPEGLRPSNPRRGLRPLHPRSGLRPDPVSLSRLNGARPQTSHGLKCPKGAGQHRGPQGRGELREKRARSAG
ncbi:hypothetical protein GCM10022284_44740 [Streptomyces hundungensis]